MKCEKCGAEIPAGSENCPSCNNISDKSIDNKQSDSQSKTKAADSVQTVINTGANESGASEQNNKENTADSDSEFELRYSSAFEKSGSGDNEYKIDEELKRKREARYDESFSNMTNDEKIKALEAARLARKEKRDRKLAKKDNGGFLGSLLNGSERSEKPVASAVKTEREVSENTDFVSFDSEAASGSDKSDDLSKTVLMDTDEVKKELAKSSAGSKSASKSIIDKIKGFNLKPNLGIILGCIVAVLVVGVIIASVNMASKAGYGEPETPTVYAKGNELYGFYDGKEVQLSQNFIAQDFEDQNESDERIKEKDLIHYSSGGEVTYYIDTADMNEKSGSLKYVKNNKKKSIESIANNVYYDVRVSDDGTGVLYLTGADSSGMGGTLNYWSPVTKKSVKISNNVNIGNFMFIGDDNVAAYISEYNSENSVGDLHVAYITKGEISESKKIESDVYKVFGANPSGKTVVYAKGYNNTNKCFDVYMMKENSSEAVLVTDGSRCEPIIAKTTDNMFVGGGYENYYQTLYYASLESGQKEKIASGLTELIEISKDEQAVVFRKANAEGTAFDYFYAHQTGSDAQELAMNVTVLDDEDHKRVCQFDINDDFTKAVYIQGYDTANESGTLFTVSINNSSVSSDKKISDTAYSCNLTPDGSTIRYADNYDVAWNLVTLNAYNGEKSTILAEEVGAGAFTFDKAGEYIVYAKNYSLENRTGDVYCVDNKGKTRDVVDNVSSYGLKGNGEIVYSEKVNDADTNLFFAAPNGKRSKCIDKGVSKVVSY